MTNVYDITEFGAVGDGIADCTDAIQQALDRAGETKGKVIVPPGRYLTGRVKMKEHTRLEGDSAWSFRSDGSSVLVLNDPKADCLLDISGAFGCAVSGLCMDGCGLGEGIHGIKLYWDKYNGGSEEDTPCFDDVRIGHFSGDGIHLEHIWCFSLRHSMIHNNRGSGLYMDGWDAFISDNWFTANVNGGILGGPCCASVTATGNRVEWNKRAGFEFISGDSVQVTGNFFDRSFGPALKLGGKEEMFYQCTITGNFFRRSGCPDGMNFESDNNRCHVWFDGADNVTLTGNTFMWGEGDGGTGSKSPDYGIILSRCDSVAVIGNALKHGCIKDKIIWDGKGECVISLNTGCSE